jgi:hypothetical protein
MIDNFNCVYFIARSLWFSLRLGDPVRVAQGCLAEGALEVNAARSKRALRRARAFIEAGARLAAEVPRESNTAFVHMAHGMDAYGAGEWEVACRRLGEGVAALRRNAGMASSAVKFGDVGEWMLFMSEALMGRYAEAELRRARLRREADDRGDVYLRISIELGRATFVDLAYDRGDDLRRAVPSWLERWSARHESRQRCNAVLSLSMVDLYEGNAQRAVERIRRHWGQIQASSMLFTTITELFLRHIHGVARLSSPDQGERRRGVREVQREMRRLDHDELPSVQPHLALFRGACAAVDGRVDEWRHGLELAARQFDERAMAGHAASCRHRLGDVVGGDEGHALVARAEAELAELGVKKPRWFARVLVPAPEPA